MAIGEGIQSTNQGRHDYVEEGRVVGFFTDPTVCIGCKACEVACKEWNQVPDDGFEWSGNSYDNTGDLGASTWRHVLFVEQDRALAGQVAGPMGLERRGADAAGSTDAAESAAAAETPMGLEPDAFEDPFRWVFLSDVCKHCEVAGCLEACPTGSIVRTETGAVYVQDDVCNGCGYCVVGCPFGVIDRREDKDLDRDLPGAGGAFKCTFCYDRQSAGMVPACAKVCPTESIQFGPLDELRARAAIRVEELRDAGHTDARLYDPTDTSVGGIHAFFLLLGEPEAYGLPARPEVPTVYQKSAWGSALLTSAAALAGSVLAFALWR